MLQNHLLITWTFGLVVWTIAIVLHPYLKDRKINWRTTWTYLLILWTIGIGLNYYFTHLKTPTRDFDAELAKLSKAQIPSERVGINGTVIGLLNQAEQLSRFIDSGVPEQVKAEAIRKLESTKRQAALAASQQNLGLAWDAPVADPGQFPYEVAVILNNLTNATQGYRCGGVLINPSWVLTAGHCFMDDSEANDFQVYLGHVNLSDYSQDCGCFFDLQALKRVPQYHPIDVKVGNYIGTGYDGDVALLQLKKPVSSVGVGNIQPATEALEKNLLKLPLGTIVGWGKTSGGQSPLSNALRYGTVKVRPDAICSTSYGSIFDKVNMICATPAPTDACAGDSGGPLILRYRDTSSGTPVEYVEGVISWTVPSGGCPSTKPTIYARVPTFSNWISDCIKGMPCPSSLPQGSLPISAPNLKTSSLPKKY